MIFTWDGSVERPRDTVVNRLQTCLEAERHTADELRGQLEDAKAGQFFFCALAILCAVFAIVGWLR